MEIMLASKKIGRKSNQEGVEMRLQELDLGDLNEKTSQRQ
jgi:hypothetical protein